MTASRNVISTALVAIGAAFIAAGCGNSADSSSGSKGSIRIDGSSTVAPLSEAAAELFQAEHRDVRVTVGTSGTGGGFKRFCAGETDISDASRSIEPDEIAACKKNGVKYEELHVANDGLAIVVNTDNDWAKCLTTDELKKIWDSGSKVESWKDINASFPDEKLELFGPGTDSGTFDYFTKAINGEEGRSRTDYNATEDDNVSVTGVEGSRGGLAYFGLSYAEQNADKLRIVEVDSGKGCVVPTTKSVQSGDYAPLSRPLFIYPSAKLLARDEGTQFIDFYASNSEKLAKQALFVPLTTEQQATLEDRIEALKG